MRIARVIGQVTLSKKDPNLKAGSLLLVDVLDRAAIAQWPLPKGHKVNMPESLVVFDELGAGMGQLIAVSEGREACMPFHPSPVPLDAYCSAILDSVQITVK
jgi:microcompartment protein CcmK/EutM